MSTPLRCLDRPGRLRLGHHRPGSIDRFNRDWREPGHRDAGDIRDGRGGLLATDLRSPAGAIAPDLAARNTVRRVVVRPSRGVSSWGIWDRLPGR